MSETVQLKKLNKMTDSKTIVSKMSKVWLSMRHKVSERQVFKTRKLCL